MVILDGGSNAQPSKQRGKSKSIFLNYRKQSKPDIEEDLIDLSKFQELLPAREQRPRFSEITINNFEKTLDDGFLRPVQHIRKRSVQDQLSEPLKRNLQSLSGCKLTLIGTITEENVEFLERQKSSKSMLGSENPSHVSSRQTPIYRKIDFSSMDPQDRNRLAFVV